MALAVLSAAALAGVIVLWIVVATQQRHFDDITQANQSAASLEASATAQSFYRSLLAAEAAAPLTSARLQAVGHEAGIAARPPVDGSGVLLVDYRVSKGYVMAGGFEGGEGLVQQCYRAILPKPGSGRAGSLNQRSCGTEEY